MVVTLFSPFLRICRSEINEMLSELPRDPRWAYRAVFLCPKHRSWVFSDFLMFNNPVWRDTQVPNRRLGENHHLWYSLLALCHPRTGEYGIHEHRPPKFANHATRRPQSHPQARMRPPRPATPLMPATAMPNPTFLQISYSSLTFLPASPEERLNFT